MICFQWSELVHELRTSQGLKNKNDSQAWNTRNSDKKISYVNHIQRVLILLILLLLKMKIDLTTTFDIEYLHILNPKYTNYSYVNKPHFLHSYHLFLNKLMILSLDPTGT